MGDASWQSSRVPGVMSMLLPGLFEHPWETQDLVFLFCLLLRLPKVTSERTEGVSN